MKSGGLVHYKHAVGESQYMNYEICEDIASQAESSRGVIFMELNIFSVGTQHQTAILSFTLWFNETKTSQAKN